MLVHRTPRRRTARPWYARLPSKYQNATKGHARNEAVERTNVAIGQVSEGGSDGNTEGVNDDYQCRTGFFGDPQHLCRIDLDLNYT
jgi:hypothetical protein